MKMIKVKQLKYLRTFCVLNFIIFVIIVMLSVDINTSNFDVPQPQIKLNLMKTKRNYKEPQQFIINTSNCQIPDFDPFDEELMLQFNSEKYE